MIQQLTSHREIDDFLFINNTPFFPVINTSTAFSSVFTLHQHRNPFFPIINDILFSLH
jgi:hypothetical protein